MCIFERAVFQRITKIFNMVRGCVLDTSWRHARAGEAVLEKPDFMLSCWCLGEA